MYRLLLFIITVFRRTSSTAYDHQCNDRLTKVGVDKAILIGGCGRDDVFVCKRKWRALCIPARLQHTQTTSKCRSDARAFLYYVTLLLVTTENQPSTY